MSDLHVKWMDEEGPTDVLSFPMDEVRPAPAGHEPVEGLLGDAVVCPTLLAEQAKVAGHATIEEALSRRTGSSMYSDTTMQHPRRRGRRSACNASGHPDLPRHTSITPMIDEVPAYLYIHCPHTFPHRGRASAADASCHDVTRTEAADAMASGKRGETGSPYRSTPCSPHVRL